MEYVNLTWDMIWYMDMVIYHTDMVILDIDQGKANDMEDDSIDMVISHIDMGYLVTLMCESAPGEGASQRGPAARGLQPSTSRLILTRFCHLHTDTNQHVPQKVLKLS